jgi:glycosyltransferase involved in cell wall biosynthesis
MRICFLAWHGSIHTRRWVGWFAERGHEVHVVTCGGGSARDLDADGNPLPLRYQVHDLGEPRFGKLGYFLVMARARQVVRAIAPDVIHAHWLTSYGLLALAARERHAGAAPLIATAHGDDVLIAPRNALMRRLVQRVLRAAQMITVPSEVMREAVLDLLDPQPAPRGGVTAFQYGIECARLAAIGADARRARDPRGNEPLRIVSARSFLALYRIDALIDALGLLRERGVAFECNLYGDGPLRDDLEAQATQLGIDDACTFHGAVEPAEVERQVAAADLYVSVSESDGVSLALLEALALGAVPVLSDIPANRPWVNDAATGVLVEIDPQAIADGIERAATLDRERVAADNFSVVAERADRDTNLAACEILIDSLIGVTWDADPAADDTIDDGRNAA